MGPGRWRLFVFVQPGAKKDEVAGLRQDRIRIRLSAKAVDNKANKALVAFVAARLKVRRGQLSLESGQTSRQKTLLIETDREPYWEEAFPGCVVQGINP